MGPTPVLQARSGRFDAKQGRCHNRREGSFTPCQGKEPEPGGTVDRTPRTLSLVAERAVRFLRSRTGPVDSVSLAAALLATRTTDEATARQVLEAALGSDPRLCCGRNGWSLAEPAGEREPQPVEPERVLLLIQGERPQPGRPFVLRGVSVLRLQGDEVIAACGGDTAPGAGSSTLRAAVIETLSGAALVVHDAPGALRALERWLDEPLDAPISLRRLARARLGLPVNHDLETLVARLGLVWRDSDDPLDQADSLDACLRALRRSGESLDALRLASSRGGATPLDWSRYAFDRAFLRAVPRAPGAYRFFDAGGKLLYVGKSNNLRSRLESYFREGAPRARRVQALLDRLHRIEYESTGSELEAILTEAARIRRENPAANVQRHVHEGRGARLRSILILEPAAPPHVLRAYLIHEGRLVGRVGIGRRGGGLRRIERLLHDHFFFAPDGPTPVAGPDVDVELVVRWLATARDRAVAFDPTTLRSAAEVTERLRFFLAQGSPLDPDGSPSFPR